ncbi:MAG: hypothetical protein HQL41_06835 [Alphaproteobacteria bacterium]|nr:hypothetical protein [Alphaproteobacteria bacterium]
MTQRLLTGIAWGFFFVFCLAAGTLMFQACGLSLPGIGTIVAACDPPRLQTPPEAHRTAYLQAQLLELERRLTLAPPCATGTCEARSSGDRRPTDILLLQDATGSFASKLSSMRPILDALETWIRRQRSDIRVGLAIFQDKPREPFGKPEDLVLRIVAPLSADTQELKRAVANLRVPDGSGGATVSEAQFEAIVESLGTESGYRSLARRFLVVITDAAPHVAGDWADAPAPEDGAADGDPLNEDYPSDTQVSELLSRSDVVPIFLVWAGAVGRYQSFVDLHGTGSVILLDDFSQLVTALSQGLRSACR